MRTRLCEDNMWEVELAFDERRTFPQWIGGYNYEYTCAREFARVYNYDKSIAEGLHAEGYTVPDY